MKKASWWKRRSGRDTSDEIIIRRREEDDFIITPRRVRPSPESAPRSFRGWLWGVLLTVVLAGLYWMWPAPSEPQAFTQPAPEPEKSVEINETAQPEDILAVCEVTTTIWAALAKEEVPLAVQKQLELAVQWSVGLYHLPAGSTFRLLYRPAQKTDGEARLLAAQLRTSKEETAVYYHDLHDAYHTAEGYPVRRRFLMSPVRQATISSRFDHQRINPISQRVKPHLGTDYAAPKGSPILAVADGEVIQRTYRQGNGYFIKLRHDDRYETQYLHLDHRPVVGVFVGAKVAQGQCIGYVGESGYATGPHVCFRFWRDQQQVNHYQYEAEINAQMGHQLPRQDTFYRRVQDWQALLGAASVR